MMSRVALLTFAVAGASAACAPHVFLREPGHAEVQLQPQAMADQPHLVNGKAGDVVRDVPSPMNSADNFYYPVVSQGPQPDKLPAGSSFRLECPRNNAQGHECHTYACVFYMFVYHCPACYNVKTGGWAGLFAGEDAWTSSSCSPKFTHGADSFRQPTVAHRTVVSSFGPAGGVVTPASTDLTDFMGFYAGSVHENDELGCPPVKHYGPYPTNPCAKNCPQY